MKKVTLFMMNVMMTAILVAGANQVFESAKDPATIQEVKEITVYCNNQSDVQEQ